MTASGSYIFHNQKLATQFYGERRGVVQPRHIKTRTIVSLRRAGDIINLLPLLKHIHDQGTHVRLVVHRDYANILEGVSYAEPVIWEGDMEDALAACRLHHAENAQVWGKNLRPDIRLSNFAHKAWEQLGAHWHRYLPLVFDRRNRQREQELIDETFKTDRPKLLVKLHGFSSPYKHGSRILDALHRNFDGLAEIVNLDDIQALRVYDLLGLMDYADCLLSIDTVMLHLNRSHRLPTIALVNNTPWGASPCAGNTVLRVHYQDIEKRWQEIKEMVLACLQVNWTNRDIALTYSDWTPTNPETILRHKRAQETWSLLLAKPVPHQGGRSSAEIGDKHALPYFHDMIERAMTETTAGIIAIVNNDIAFDRELAGEVRDSCVKNGCYWAHRLDKPGGTTDNGVDFVAFTRKWWKLHKGLFPDFLFGSIWWDDMIARLMIWSGCEEGKRLYYHETHPGAMETRRDAPHMAHNEKLAREWMREHGEQWAKPIDIPGVVMTAQPKVWVFTIVWNEARNMPWFLRHYRTFADRIIVFDENSDDGTREMVKACPIAELREWKHKGLDDARFIQAVNTIYREAIGKADWVIWADCDELLYHPRMLDMLREVKGDVVPATGWALISTDRTPPATKEGQIYELVKTGARQENFDKRILWRPSINMTHAIGRHTYPGRFPKHNGLESVDHGVKLFHLHYLGGMEATSQRNKRNYDRSLDKKLAWNFNGDSEAKRIQGTVGWVEDLIRNKQLVNVV